MQKYEGGGDFTFGSIQKWVKSKRRKRERERRAKVSVNNGQYICLKQQFSSENQNMWNCFKGLSLRCINWLSDWWLPRNLKLKLRTVFFKLNPFSSGSFQITYSGEQIMCRICNFLTVSFKSIKLLDGSQSMFIVQCSACIYLFLAS